ncbi:MAG TPA: glycosyltransferase [Steroidobacteraceae bacterium]|nr:glycosyltransferase [Steroidobacteraceae bacterium]
MSRSDVLLFVSTRFLFPVDSGGKIRTTQILRGMKGGRFRIRLVSPATAELVERYRAELDEVCDEFVWWPQAERGRVFHFARLRHVLGSLPIPVRTDRSRAAIATVGRELARSPAVAVFDFLHAAVLAPVQLDCPAVMFTHNVEAEIFARHQRVAKNFATRALWQNQHAKMERFERASLARFDVVVAVSDRDAQMFAKSYGHAGSFVIPTGVDLDFFSFRAPERDRDVVFCGSMDWLANQEAMSYFMDEVWQRIVAAVPDARMTVVGRAPPRNLTAEAARRGLAWTFSGFVDDVRPHMHGAAVSVIPLRVGGGTRLKVFEAMAMGSPVVSTSIGVEGLELEPGRHYLRADDAGSFADAVIALLRDRPRRTAIANEARRYVEERFSYRVAAAAFEQACELAIRRATGRQPDRIATGAAHAATDLRP